MKFKRLAIALVMSLASACMIAQDDAVIIKDGTPIAGGSERLVNLDQGWSQSFQAGYWYGGDGSLIVPYDYFLNLEQASSTELFRSDSNIERLRYIPIPKSSSNPNGMPVGFSKNHNPIDNTEWVALSCAGCHASKISYQGTSMVINGAATMGDFQMMMRELEDAMVATLKQDDKFERFAKKLLGKNYSPATSQNLRTDFKTKTDGQVGFNHRNRTPSKYGFGRVDAFGYAYNNIGVNFLGIPENKVLGIAPSNYNYIWGSVQSDVLQWNGSAPNRSDMARLFRVLGDVWGGGGLVNLHSSTSTSGYESTANIKGLKDMLSWVKVLQSPRWPEFILPAIDQAKADKGRDLYEDQCVQCHQLTLTRAEQMEDYNAVMVPQAEVGTDRAELVMIEEAIQKTGVLEGAKALYIAGPELGATAPAKSLLNVVSFGVMVRDQIDITAQDLQEFVGPKGAVKNNYQYKARPLTGIWATAPYLHNGSVPNLYQLLLPSTTRDTVFYTGNREFDPTNVGQISLERADLFKFDTSLYGNDNIGHDYGTTMNDQQRFELIEFMKTL